MKSRIILSLTFVLAFSINGFAQWTFRVGDTVEYRCNCFGKEWVRAKVEAIEGNTIRVRYGNVRNQAATVAIASGDVRSVGGAKITTSGNQTDNKRAVVDNSIADAARLAADDKVRWAFRAEAADKYYRTVAQFAPSYDERYISGGSPNTPAEWQKAMSDLAELDTLCKSKYPGITDSLIYLREGIIDYRYAQWCDIAAKRLTLEPKARARAAAYGAYVPGADDLKRALEYEDNRVIDDIQLLMYEPEKWKAKHSVEMKAHFAKYGAEMPANFFDETIKKGAELKAKIDQGAPGRSFRTSANRDAAVDSFIKGKFRAEYPGSQILASRLDYPNWVKRESLSLAGSGTGYKLYKVEYNFYKRGWVLMKMPNRPFCQAREWIVGRGAKGLVAVSTSSQGTFMKCQ
ncbi:MAG TPA: hypothetical protein VIT19_12345 [Pyrinomonadaceae bacterium]